MKNLLILALFVAVVFSIQMAHNPRAKRDDEWQAIPWD